MKDLKYVYRSTNLKCVISIDDDWNYNNTPEAILYDLFQLSTEEKMRLFAEIRESDAHVATILYKAIEELEKIKFTVDGKAKYEIYRYIDGEESLNIIKSFSNFHLEKIENVTQKYGVGLQSTGIISLKDTIAAAREMGIPIRIYTDFLNDDKTHFEKTIGELTSDEGYVFCIIDDNMKKEKRADEIIKLISENTYYQKKVACVLVTSGDNSQKARRDSDIYVEFIKKQTTKDAMRNFNNDLSVSYLKSLYRVMLSSYQNAKKDAIDTVFKNLYGNVNTARYISTIARDEGVTNFELINKWISSKERNEIEEQKIDDIKNIISLSNVLSNLQESDSISIDEADTDIELYSNDAYDKTVNILHKTIDVGDIFEVKGSYFVLIGQECDLGVRHNGKRKTEVLEFVAAKLYSSTTEIVKNQFTYEQALIYNFPTEDGSLKYFAVDCSKRFYGKPEMFDICTYNSDGVAKIDLANPLEYKITTLLPEGLINLYSQIQQRFCNFNQVKDLVEDSQLFKSFIKTIGLSNENNQVLDYDSFSIDDNVVTYPIRRVCRLRKHAQLLHRMYLNYRGRQAEEAVCFSRYIEMDYNLGNATYRAKCFLSSKTRNNTEDRLCKRPWIVMVEDINNHLESEGKELLHTDEIYLSLHGTAGKQADFAFEKSYNQETKEHFLKLT